MSILPHSELPFFANLLLLLVVARVLGEIMERLKQPAMIGEIAAGIILGPSLLNICHFNPELKVFSEMAVFLLVIMAGLEIDPNEIIKLLTNRKILIAIFGFIIPIGLGIMVGKLFGLNNIITLFIGLCISITALPVSIRILIDLKRLHTDIGKSIISAAIFNDVVALMILGILIDAHAPSQNYIDIGYTIFVTLVKVLLFIAVVIVVYQFINSATQKVTSVKTKIASALSFFKGKESMFALVFCFILVFANISESSGLHFVLGAFFGAMLINKNLVGEKAYEEIEKTTSSITMGFLAPIFFAVIGLEFQFATITNIPLLLSILVVSFASKIFGGYLGARLAGMSKPAAITIGFGLNGRGVMELVIANIALQAGIIDYSLFSILVLMGILTTISTPILLKKGFHWMDKAGIN